MDFDLASCFRLRVAPASKGVTAPRAVIPCARWKLPTGIVERRGELKKELRVADETHFVACDESEPFVNRAAIVRSVKQQSVEVLIL
jgi:hypothetical protein